MTKLLKRWLKTNIIVLLLVTLSLGLSTAWWTPSSSAALPAGNAITDGKALLRYALPIDNQAVRKLQASLEDIATQLRANRRWGAISADLTKATDKTIASLYKRHAQIPEPVTVHSTQHVSSTQRTTLMAAADKPYNINQFLF